MRASVLHNPTAGSGEVAAQDLLAALGAAGIAPRYRSTEEPDFAEVLEQPADLVVAAGGDGTVVKVIGQLRDRSRPLAILPLGGANNIARSLGITADPLAIARTGWRGAMPRRLDVGTAVGPWGTRLFVEAVGVGALAETAAAVDQQDVRGPEKSELARATLLEVLAEAQPEVLRLAIDGHRLECRCLLAEIMNIPLTGPKLSLAPAADPGDGLLDLVLLEPEARTAMQTWLRTRSADVPPLTVRRGRHFAFEWRHGRLHVSDSFPPPPPPPCPIEVTLLPEPVTVLVPASLEDRGGRVA